MGLALPKWKAYAEQVNLGGAFAIVDPYPPGTQVITRQRVAGSLGYKLSRVDNRCWSWVPIEGSVAQHGEYVTGGRHQVAVRTGCSPSDPTIEQFRCDTLMYIVEE